MSIKLTFKKQLTDDEIEYYNGMALGQPHGSIYQCTHWLDLHSNEYTDRIFFWDSERSGVVAGALLIHENAIAKFAEIRFGPVVPDLSRLVEIVDALMNYSKTRFHWLKISLPYPLSNETETLERLALKNHNMKFDMNGSNWATLVVQLDRPLDQIFRSFRKGHKSDVKKALKKFQVRVAKNDNDFRNFAGIYIKMCNHRGIRYDYNATMEKICGLGYFLTALQCGAVYLVYDHSDVIGGAVFLSSGKRYIYYMGASDPQRRQDPIAHLSIWHAIQDAHALVGVNIFDLGGYNIYVGKEEQIFYINRFKSGFSKRLEFFPKTQYYVFSPFHYLLYKNRSLIKKITSFRKNK